MLWAAAADPSQSFLQFGAVGAGLLIALAAVRYLYKAQATAWKDRAERAEARADRLETALANVNEGAVAQARAAVEAANATVSEAIRRLETSR